MNNHLTFIGLQVSTWSETALVYSLVCSFHPKCIDLSSPPIQNPLFQKGLDPCCCKWQEFILFYGWIVSRGYNGWWNKSVRERQIPYDFTHVQNLRSGWNEWKKKTQKNRLLENELVITRVEVDRWMRRWGNGGMGEINEGIRSTVI